MKVCEIDVKKCTSFNGSLIDKTESISVPKMFCFMLELTHPRHSPTRTSSNIYDKASAESKKRFIQASGESLGLRMQKQLIVIGRTPSKAD